MDFKESLENILREKGLTRTDLRKMTGLSTASISQYFSGSNEPTTERKVLIAKALGLPDSYFLKKETVVPVNGMKVEKINVESAAKLMGVTRTIIEQGLIQKVFPWGYAIKRESKWYFFINYKNFMKTEMGVDV